MVSASIGFVRRFALVSSDDVERLRNEVEFFEQKCSERPYKDHVQLRESIRIPTHCECSIARL